MTHRNVTGWAMPVIKDGDIIEGGNLSNWNPPTDINITVKSALLIGAKEDYPSNITFENCTFIPIVAETEPEPIQNLQVASKAELVFRSLLASGKLSNEMVPVIEQLQAKILQKTNVTDIELGLAATIQTQEIIDSFKQIGDNETALQLEQALQAVQAIWRAE